MGILLFRKLTFFIKETSMHMIHIKELFQHAEQYYDQTIQVCGWIRSIRDSKNFGFIVINDGTFFQPLQIVYDNTLDPVALLQHRTPNNRLSCMPAGSLSKAPPVPIILFKKRDILWNICARFLIFVLAPIHFRPYSGSALWLHMPYTNFFRKTILSMSTRH